MPDTVDDAPEGTVPYVPAPKPRRPRVRDVPPHPARNCNATGWLDPQEYQGAIDAMHRHGFRSMSAYIRYKLGLTE